MNVQNFTNDQFVWLFVDLLKMFDVTNVNID